MIEADLLIIFNDTQWLPRINKIFIYYQCIINLIIRRILAPNATVILQT